MSHPYFTSQSKGEGLRILMRRLRCYRCCGMIRQDFLLQTLAWTLKTTSPGGHTSGGGGGGGRITTGFRLGIKRAST